MIVVENGVETVKTNGVLYSRPETIRALGIMLISSMAEGTTDMICDAPEEYPTKNEIEALYQNCGQMALDALEDHIEDLRRNLESFLQNVKFKAQVRRLDYNKQGELSDVSVDIVVE